MMVVALAAVCAFGAVGTAVASAALPEIVNKEGKELVKKKFTGTVTGKVILGTSDTGEQFEFCKTGSAAGEIAGLSGGKVTTTFHACEFGLRGECQSAGSKNAGEIVLPMSIKLVYLNRAKKEAALLYSLPSAGISMECEGNAAKLSGAFLVGLGTVNKLSTKYVLTAKGHKWTQEPSEYENEKGEKVKATPKFWFVGESEGEASLQFTEGVVFEEEVEFKV
jgi:hypothetical protein